LYFIFNSVWVAFKFFGVLLLYIEIHLNGKALFYFLIQYFFSNLKISPGEFEVRTFRMKEVQVLNAISKTTLVNSVTCSVLTTCIT